MLDVLEDYLEEPDITDPHDFSYYPQIEAAYEGEDVFPELLLECAHRGLQLSYRENVDVVLGKCKGNIADYGSTPLEQLP